MSAGVSTMRRAARVSSSCPSVRAPTTGTRSARRASAHASCDVVTSFSAATGPSASTSFRFVSKFPGANQGRCERGPVGPAGFALPLRRIRSANRLSDVRHEHGARCPGPSRRGRLTHPPGSDDVSHPRGGRDLPSICLVARGASPFRRRSSGARSRTRFPEASCSRQSKRGRPREYRPL